MKGINIVVINGEEVDLKSLHKEERERLAGEWNNKGLMALGYQKEETA